MADDFAPGERAPSADEESPAAQRELFVHPLLFLSGLYNDRTPTPDQEFAVSPSLSLIIGEYGWGKTELIFQLCDHMANSVEIPLAINLSLCRDFAGVLDHTPTAETMARLLFGKIVETAGVEESIVLEQIVPEIRDGRIVLLLDGLDELVSAPAQHRAFFTGLLKLLAGGDGEPFFRVAVSMRLEYLSSVAPDPEEIKRLVAREFSDPPAVYFMILEPLRDSHVKAYLSVRSAEVPNLVSIFDEVKLHPRLLEMLRRPLFLRIFCDVASYRGFRLDSLLTALQHNDGRTELLRTLTESAAGDDQLLDDQQLLVPVVWKPATLAAKALELYKAGRDRLTIGDVYDILAPAPGATIDIRGLSPELAIKGIHKCPFLQETSASPHLSPAEEVAEFGHKLFFEYFVARGMAEERPRDPGTGRRMFDELVLSVDMRKFLRGFLPEEEWRRQTAYAYGLDDPGQWQPPLNEERRTELEAKRWVLLQSMTDPESLPPGTVGAIDWLLGGDTGWLHPRYLIYTFEAVAVYLWYHRTSPEAPAIRERLGEVLEAKLGELLAAPPPADRDMRRANALLIERILDIARRVRYLWGEDFGRDRTDEILQAIDPEDSDIIQRIEKLLEDIRQTVFLRAGRVPPRAAPPPQVGLG